jgi:phosphoglycolate phosphatase
VIELDLVIFDIAGTTIHATDQVPAAFSEAFANVGIELSDAEIQAVRGKSKLEAIAELLNQRLDAAKVYADFQEILLRRYETHGVEAIDGAEASFNWLKGHNTKVALSTGFGRDLAEMLIREVGWEDSFDAVICNEDVVHGRPAPDMIFRAMERTGCESVDRVTVVGDTVSDLQAAENAGVRWSIGVLSGAHSEAQLRACPHTAIIPSVAVLADTLVGG